MTDNDGVLSRSRGNGEFDLGIGSGELGEKRLDEATVVMLEDTQNMGEGFHIISRTSFPWNYQPNRSSRSLTSCTAR